MSEKKSSYYNVGVTIVLASILYFTGAAGAIIAFVVSGLSTAFWIAVLAVVLYLIFKK